MCDGSTIAYVVARLPAPPECAPLQFFINFCGGPTLYLADLLPSLPAPESTTGLAMPSLHLIGDADELCALARPSPHLAVCGPRMPDTAPLTFLHLHARYTRPELLDIPANCELASIIRHELGHQIVQFRSEWTSKVHEVVRGSVPPPAAALGLALYEESLLDDDDEVAASSLVMRGPLAISTTSTTPPPPCSW